MVRSERSEVRQESGSPWYGQPPPPSSVGAPSPLGSPRKPPGTVPSLPHDPQDSSQTGLLPQPERGDRGAAEPESRSGTIAHAELAAAVKGTFMAVIKHALSAVDPSGLSQLLKAAELLLAAVKWLELCEGRRDVDVAFPIPLGAGIELDLSVHAGHSPSAAEPLVTACFAPVGEPDPGVLVVDGCQISPGDTLDEKPVDHDGEAARHALEHETEEKRARPVDEEGQVVFVRLDLSQLTAREPDPRVRAAALMYLSRGQLLTDLRQQSQWDDLEAAGVECVVFYDQEAKESVWLFLGDARKRSVRRRIMFDAAGRLVCGHLTDR
jgi:hypothetical protein